MRVTIKLDSIEPNDLDRIVNAHRLALRYSTPPWSIEADASMGFNYAMWVAVEGAGFKARTVPLTQGQAKTFIENL